MRILFALPGFHRYERGAEIALLSLASELARGGDEVTLIGSGPPRASVPYRYIQSGSIRRERFERLPRLPLFRNETGYEEATFAPGLWARVRPGDYDVTVTCSYPFTNWVLRARRGGRGRPAHVFVTQNGDWPAVSDDAEYARFGCDGLVCTNPEFFQRNRARWRSALIPNGIDLTRFASGPAERGRFGLPEDRKVVLMVSALIASKRVVEGITAVAALPDVHLIVAGDGPLRDEVDRHAASAMPGRFQRVTVGAAEMPALYRSADAFLHMSLEESFGNVFLEAMACGLPVVAEDSARIRWIVGDDEHLCRTQDMGATSAAIAGALAGAGRPVPARKSRAAAFSWPNIAGRYRSFFEEVLSAGGDVGAG